MLTTLSSVMLWWKRKTWDHGKVFFFPHIFTQSRVVFSGIITEKERGKIQQKENNDWWKFYRWERGDQYTGEKHTPVQTKGKEVRWGMDRVVERAGTWKSFHLITSIFPVEEQVKQSANTKEYGFQRITQRNEIINDILHILK